MSKILDPGQARHFVWPDLGLNCLQKLSADDTSRQRIYEHSFFWILAIMQKILCKKKQETIIEYVLICQKQVSIIK